MILIGFAKSLFGLCQQKMKNHRLLFYLELIPPTQWTKEIAVNQVQKTPLQAVETSYSVLLNIVPVVVRANGKEIPTFALLD